MSKTVDELYSEIDELFDIAEDTLDEDLFQKFIEDVGIKLGYYNELLGVYPSERR
jgi:hypothetical protein